MLCEEVSITLTNLPSDIIRAVIGAVPELYENFRRISPRWNALVLQNVAERKFRVPIKRFSWITNHAGEIIVVIRLAKTCRSFFGLNGNNGNKNQWEPLHESALQGQAPIEFISFDSGTLFNIHESNNESAIANRFSRFFGRCSRIGIMNLHLGFHIGEAGTKHIQDAMSRVVIDELKFTGVLNFSESASTILKIIQGNVVGCLEVSISDHSIQGSADFFIQAIKAASSIEISINYESRDKFDLHGGASTFMDNLAVWLNSLSGVAAQNMPGRGIEINKIMITAKKP